MEKEVEYEVTKDGCYLCTSHAKSKDGHCAFTRNGRHYLIHRYVYEKVNGEIPEGMIIRHKCDNPSCINIDHLEIGTHEDNVRDRVNRDRSAKGENHGRAKLKEDDVIEIMTNNKESNLSLAKKYDVDPRLIRMIKKREIWKHLA